MRQSVLDEIEEIDSKAEVSPDKVNQIAKLKLEDVVQPK